MCACFLFFFLSRLTPPPAEGRKWRRGDPPEVGGGVLGTVPGASSPLCRPAGVREENNAAARPFVCAAPSPEGRRRALQRPGAAVAAASVVLPPLLLVVLTACGRPGLGLGLGPAVVAVVGSGRRAGGPRAAPEPGIGSAELLDAGQPGQPPPTHTTPPPSPLCSIGSCGRESVEGE